MSRGNPQNHPKPGDSIRVDPIRNPKDIEAIKKLLHGDLMRKVAGIKKEDWDKHAKRV